MKKLILLLSIALSFHSSKALITRVDVLANPKQKVYLLSDWHLDTLGGAKTIKQHTDILSILKRFKQYGEVSLLVEDTDTIAKKLAIKLYTSPKKIGAELIRVELRSGPNDDPSQFPESLKTYHEQICDWSLCKDNQSDKHYVVSPMSYLSHFAKKIPGIFVHNVEVDTMIRNDLNDHKSNIVESLHQYTDKLHPKLDAYRSFLKEGIEVYNQSSDQQKLNQHIFNIRRFLVDARILNRCIMSENVPHLFITAGAYHIENIKPNLLNNGYRVINSFGISHDEADLHKAEDNFIVNNALDLEATFEKIHPAYTSYYARSVNYIKSLANRFLNSSENTTE